MPSLALSTTHIFVAKIRRYGKLYDTTEAAQAASQVDHAHALSHAFHPVDGLAQSVSYYILTFVLALQKVAYVALFVDVDTWTVLIHNGECLTDNPVFNGAACHSLHHFKLGVNYEQFFMFHIRLCDRHMKPDVYLFEKEQRMSERVRRQEVNNVDQLVVEVGSVDDRAYGPETRKIQ